MRRSAALLRGGAGPRNPRLGGSGRTTCVGPVLRHDLRPHVLLRQLDDGACHVLLRDPELPRLVEVVPEARPWPWILLQGEAKRTARRRRSSSRTFRKAWSCSSSVEPTPAGSARPQWKRRTFPRKTGQTSSAHSVMTASTSAGSISSMLLERWARMSIPISSSARIANGFTFDGRDPADEIFT